MERVLGSTFEPVVFLMDGVEQAVPAHAGLEYRVKKAVVCEPGHTEVTDMEDRSINQGSRPALYV